MPPAGFFGNLGLFVRSGFFDRATCDRIRCEMCAKESRKALIYGTTGSDETLLDENERKVLITAHMEKSTKVMVTDQISGLRSSLEEHFAVPLGEIEKPSFLRYGEGNFFKPHRDAHPAGPGEMSKRRVSVVIFLNGGSSEPSENCYGGGALTFYGLLD